jgi:hypothetical protein
VIGTVQVPEADTRDVDHDSAPVFGEVNMSIHAVIRRREHTCGYLGVRPGVHPSRQRKPV